MSGLSNLLIIVFGFAFLGLPIHAHETKYAYSGDGALTDFAI